MGLQQKVLLIIGHIFTKGEQNGLIRLLLVLMRALTTVNIQKYPTISTLGTKPNLTPLFPVQALLTSKNT